MLKFSGGKGVGESGGGELVGEERGELLRSIPLIVVRSEEMSV